MPPETPISAIAHVIQLAIAPVFLITGVCTLLNVLANRLGRIVDRARALEAQLQAPNESRRAQMEAELKRLCRRARMVNMAITCSTISALLTCIMISTLFTGTFVPANLAKVITVLFVAAMLLLFLALLAFLGEVILATRNLRITATSQASGKSSAAGPRPLVEE